MQWFRVMNKLTCCVQSSYILLTFDMDARLLSHQGHVNDSATDKNEVLILEYLDVKCYV
uniref:Uncharacterized protein n=1 Tax=Arion vulgaris TaxID=1028688 RepID=A0A0B7AUZ8_9EUPU